jgi:N-acetylmuramoyl-L-alanine amidase
MWKRNKYWLKIFAPVSLGFALTATFSISTRATSRDAAQPAANGKRQSASAQYTRAEEQQAAVNSKPSDKRTLADYKQVVMSYRRVALITPRAPEVPDSLLAVAELYTEMGDRFGRTYYQSAADTYQFLVREYPTNKSCQEAMLRMAKLQRDQLAEMAQAQKTYEEFLKRYPRSSHKREAEEALAELALLQNNEDTPANASPAAGSRTARSVTAEETKPNEPVHSGGKAVERSYPEEFPRVRKVRASLNGDVTRVTIDLDNTVQFTSGKIASPERIFFDLHSARLAPGVAYAKVHVEGNLLSAVRVAQNHSGVVRVVLDVNGVKDYSASLTGNPTQLVIDLYGNSPGPTAGQTLTAKSSESEASPAAIHPANPASNAVPNSLPSPRNVLPTAKNSKSKSYRASANAKPDLVRPASEAQPTRDGQSTLTRTLGLKIGRIVIDPGHGGHDTGTIGPTGLMEKDLCLDVALRLGKIIEQRLPGADVIYTRSDDTFVPLEERTNIANQAKADLFISIHANSSHDSGARGIETYYLNLKGSPEAMEVAARENATSQEGVHDLEDLVKRIAQTEKIDESKEFAQDIQDSLARRIQRASRSVKNRGVRKAPFVVLIGAGMPSILTEISFLSNPSDEKLLKQPEQRQKVAEGLYQGIASYLESMNSVTVNMPPKSRLGRHDAPASVEQSRNQR